MPTPSVFIIGDSISCYYGRHLEGMLRGQFRYDRKVGTHKLKNLDDGTDGVNGGDSRMVLAYLTGMLKHRSFRPDWLLLNCGLHDVKTDLATCQRQVGIGEYQDNLRTISAMVRQRDIRLVWVRSTPVNDRYFHDREVPASLATSRFNADIVRYNRVADRVMRGQGVPILDLYTFTRNLGAGVYSDNVHFNETGAMAQAAFLAGCLFRLRDERALAR